MSLRVQAALIWINFLDICNLKIEYEGKVIEVEEYDKILRRDASKQLEQAGSKTADTASANE